MEDKEDEVELEGIHGKKIRIQKKERDSYLVTKEDQNGEILEEKMRNEEFSENFDGIKYTLGSVEGSVASYSLSAFYSGETYTIDTLINKLVGDLALKITYDDMTARLIFDLSANETIVLKNIPLDMFEKSIDQSTEFGLGKVVLTSTNNYLQLKVISFADDYTIDVSGGTSATIPSGNYFSHNFASLMETKLRSIDVSCNVVFDYGTQGNLIHLNDVSDNIILNFPSVDVTYTISPDYYWEFRNGINGFNTIIDIISGQVATITSPNVTFDTTNGVHVDNYAGYSNAFPSNGTDSGINLGEIIMGGEDYTIEIYMKVDNWASYSRIYEGMHLDSGNRILVTRNSNDVSLQRVFFGNQSHDIFMDLFIL